LANATPGDVRIGQQKIARPVEGQALGRYLRSQSRTTVAEITGSSGACDRANDSACRDLADACRVCEEHVSVRIEDHVRGTLQLRLRRWSAISGKSSQTGPGEGIDNPGGRNDPNAPKYRIADVQIP